MKKKYKIYPKNYLFIGMILAVLIAYTLFMCILLYLTSVTSLKSFFDYKTNPIGLPKEFMFKNYVNAFTAFKIVENGKTITLAQMFGNTLIYAGGCALMSTLSPCLVAYLNVKYHFWFNKVIYTTVILAMTMPIVGAQASSIQVSKFLGLYNKIYCLPIMASGYLGTYFLVFYATFKGLSDEYMEAATIDGAGQIQIMLQIVVPLVRTTIFTVFILNFITYWNTYEAPMLYMQDYPTVAVGLFKYMYSPSSNSSQTTNMQMTGCMLLFIPIFIVFLCFKDFFMGNLTVGGIKG